MFDQDNFFYPLDKSSLGTIDWEVVIYMQRKQAARLFPCDKEKCKCELGICGWLQTIHKVSFSKFRNLSKLLKMMNSFMVWTKLYCQFFSWYCEIFFVMPQWDHHLTQLEVLFSFHLQNWNFHFRILQTICKFFHSGILLHKLSVLKVCALNAPSTLPSLSN